MKKINLITVLLLLMTVVSFQVSAQNVLPQTVIIRTFEASKKNSSMVITSPNGSIKSVELANVDIISFEGNKDNSVIIQSEINKWKSQGFTIDGLSSFSNYVGVIITTIILSKK